MVSHFRKTEHPGTGFFSGRIIQLLIVPLMKTEPVPLSVNDRGGTCGMAYFFMDKDNYSCYARKPDAPASLGAQP
jgi:hypothetical protein